jgi:hypothetical protein
VNHHSHTRTLTAEEVSIPADSKLRQLPKIAGGIGIAGLAISGGLATTSAEHFFFSYLTSFMFWLSIALGGLFFVLIHHASRAGWSVVVRRLAETVMLTLPVFILLFIPIALGTSTLYHWTHPGDDLVILAKQDFLNLPFFFVRSAIYLGLWSVLAMFFYRKSVEQDVSGDPNITLRLRWWSPIGILIFALSLTFAAVDWMMSLDPHWFSTIFGVYYFAGCVVSINAALILLSMLLQRAGLLRDVITAEHYHDLGKYVFAFLVFWAYIGFSQYMLIWYANIPEETMWFEYHTEGSWGWVGTFLCVGHFGLPFFYLMSRHIKRRRSTLAVGAVWMLLVQWVDLYWLIQPVMTHHHGGGGASFHILDITTFIGIGGVVLAVFAMRLGKNAVVPIKDPRLAESLAFENF